MEVLTYLFIALSILLGALLARSHRRLRSLERDLRAYGSSGDDGIIDRGKFSELGLVSAGMAHEISNPLSIILGRLQLLQRIYRDPNKQKELAQGLQQLQAASRRIEKTIRGLRSYVSRTDDCLEHRIPLSEVIDDVLVFCEERLRNHGIQFKTVGTEAILLRGHRGQIEQALLNLISNAFDAVDSLPEKWIEISAVEEEDVIDIYFKDSGPGIAGDVRQKMMEPFFSAKAKKGSGLGLPIVKRIAERHGGSFTYVEKAQNTTFLLELPKAA